MYNPKLVLVQGHQARSIYNPHHDAGAILRHLGVRITSEQREVQTIVSNAFVTLKDRKFNVAICPMQYSLQEKIRWVNENSNARDYLLSVHLNSFSDMTAHGSEVWYYGGNQWSLDRAKELSVIQAKSLSTRDRGAKPDTDNNHKRLGIVRDTKPAAFLLELGFMSNKSDLEKIKAFGAQAVIECAQHLLN